MAKQIKGSDIIEPKHLEEAVQQAVLLKNAYLDLDKAVKQASDSLKKQVKGAQGGSLADINAITEAYKKSNDVKKSAQTVTQQLKQAEDEEVKAKLRLQQATAIQKKLLTEEIALENKEIGTLQKLNIENNKLRRERERLNLTTKEGVSRMKEINVQLNKNNAIIKNSSDLLKKQKLNVGNYGSAVTKLTGILSQLGLAFSAFTIIKDVFSTVTNFEKANASLSAITGATGDDLEDLKGKVLDLATEMKVSATETTKLFEIVGSQMPQLLKDAEGLQTVSKSAIILSKASGDSLEASTQSLTNALNQFGLGAEHAERVMNVLAAGSLVGSAGIGDVSEAMKNFGAVASGANISVEESVALIEVLGKFGVKGAESGTKLRGSILKLQQANFGYASGQFEINDALEEAKKKMASLGSEMERDAFLQKTFGAENISTGRILLSNTKLFEEYTKGVTNTNTATDQAATNSDTLSVVIQELKAAWENLVLKWTEGTGVLGGLKVLLRFIADNLESIINWVVRGVKAWVLYKSMLTLVNKEGTGMIQMFSNLAKGVKGASFNLGTFAKGLGGILGIAAVLVPMFIDVVKSIGEMINRTTALDKVTEKFNSRMDDEHAKMEVLRVKIFQTNAGSAERKKLIDEINGTYGTTLQNLEDEAAFMLQLEDAYKKVNAQMEERIQKQLIEEELTNAFREKRRGEAMKRANEESRFAEGSIGVAELIIKDAEDDIRMLQQELFRLNNQLDETGKKRTNLNRNRPTNETVDVEKQKLDRLNALRQKHAADLVLFENEAIKMGYDRDTIDQLLFMRKKELLEEELVFIKELNLKTREEYDKTENARLKMIEEMDKRIETSKIERLEGFKEEVKAQNYMLDAMVAAQKKIVDEEQKAAERRRKLAQESIELFKKVADARIREIDRMIEKEKSALNESEQRESEFRQLAATGNLDAAESVKAEQVAQAKAQLEIERLEKKKRNLLILTTALDAASQKINNGDANAFKNTGQEIADFIAKLPKFIEGTDTTVAEALGKPNLSGEDGYIIRADGREKILNPKEAAKTGSMTTSEIANAALMYRNNQLVAGRAMQYTTTSSDTRIIKELQSVKEAIKSIDIPEHKFNFDEQNKMAIHTIKEQTRLTKNHFKTGGLFS